MLAEVYCLLHHNLVDYFLINYLIFQSDWAPSWLAIWSRPFPGSERARILTVSCNNMFITFLSWLGEASDNTQQRIFVNLIVPHERILSLFLRIDGHHDSDTK